MPLLLMLRTRIVLAASLSLTLTVIVLFLTSADGVSDVGVLWHHFCGCPPIAVDAVTLLYAPFAISLFSAFLLATTVGNAQAPGLRGEALFLLTRPSPRIRNVLNHLLLISVLAFVLPFLATAVLLGWLALVHAPALQHLADLLQLARTTVHPGALSSSPWQDLDLPRRLLALFSDTLCVCTLFSSFRWLSLAPSTPTRIAGGLIPVLLPATPVFLLLLKGKAASALLLIPTRGHGLIYLPSTLNIAAHFTFALVWLTFTLGTIRKIEL